jgi:hypothetical protein
MKRITISLPDDLAAALERESERERTSVSAIARKAIEAKLRPLPIVDGKRVIPFIGIGRSDGEGPTAAEMEDYLRKEWTIDRHRG